MMFEGDDCVAAANVDEGYGPTTKFSYINEVQSLVRGHSYGKKLLMLMKQHYGPVWLCANPEAKGDSLVKFYRDPELGLDEHVIPASESIY